MDRQRYRWFHLDDPYAYRNENLRHLGFASYAAYLQSPLWRDIRTRVLERDASVCGCCGKKATQVHHRAYDPQTLRGESLDSLSAVCARCHRKIEQPTNTRRSKWDRLHDSKLTVLKLGRKRAALWHINVPAPRLVGKPEGESD
jgi:5-methylcytosine-specific restriction endonuclease McrA